MQIILAQEEIEEAIESHVRSQIHIADNQKVSIDLKPTRGEAGFTAILDIRMSTPMKAKPVTRNVRSAPVEVVAETAPEAEEESDIIPEKDDGAEEVSGATPPTEAAEEATAEADAGETEEPRKGSIFNFAGKAGS